MPCPIPPRARAIKIPRPFELESRNISGRCGVPHHHDHVLRQCPFEAAIKTGRRQGLCAVGLNRAPAGAAPLPFLAKRARRQPPAAGMGQARLWQPREAPGRAAAGGDATSGAKVPAALRPASTAPAPPSETANRGIEDLGKNRPCQENSVRPFQRLESQRGYFQFARNCG